MKSNNSDAIAKTQTKSSKKSAKSRSKSSKSEGTISKNAAASAAASSNSLGSTPTTPTSNANPFDTVSPGSADSSKNHQKSYFGLEPRSVKIIWEQHDQSDIELAPDVCARLAEDASYKLWEFINNVKIYARHSGNAVTYDLLNEVMRDADIPPALGAMESDWDRIDYDGSFYFYSDKIIELRDEYQKEVAVTLSDGPDFVCTWPVDERFADYLRKYILSLAYVILHGDGDALNTALSEAAFSPYIGSSYRVIVIKVIQLLAFKQSDEISARCWRLLRACAINPCIRNLHCREEYFHLAEILICQLLGPFESIKLHNSPKKHIANGQTDAATEVKMEVDPAKLEQDMEMKDEFIEQENIPTQEQDHTQDHETFQAINSTQEEQIYKLDIDDDFEHVDTQQQLSPYFASPVEWEYVDDLCQTIGQLAVINGFVSTECTYHIIRRMERFFEGRQMSTEREFKYISRAVRGLIALGNYTFREFIPFVYKFKAEIVPELLWKDFALGAIYLSGSDDIFLYEWLEFLCGTDKLQPFMLYYAHFHENLLSVRFRSRKQSTFKINPKLGVRRLEWNSLAAAMCHGDDPNKALKPKPTIAEVFPELIVPNLQLNRTGTIRFKFAGCRPVIIKPKLGPATAVVCAATASKLPPSSDGCEIGQSDILIARRKLLKPLTNERRGVSLCSYYFVRI